MYQFYKWSIQKNVMINLIATKLKLLFRVIKVNPINLNPGIDIQQSRNPRIKKVFRIGTPSYQQLVNIRPYSLHQDLHANTKFLHPLFAAIMYLNKTFVYKTKYIIILSYP